MFDKFCDRERENGTKRRKKKAENKLHNQASANMAKSSSPSLPCARATRRNTACDRRAGAGSVTFCRVALKRGGAGRANWGKPGDELFDDINDFDCTQASHLEDALATAGFKWSEVHGLSDEDHCNMEALEQAMSEHWLETQKDESQEIQDEGEDFFNSLDPKSWQE